MGIFELQCTEKVFDLRKSCTDIVTYFLLISVFKNFDGLRIYVSSGSRTIALEENCHRDNYPWTIAPWMIAPRIIAPRTIASEDNCPREKLPPTIKFPPKISTPHSSKFPPQRVLRVN